MFCIGPRVAELSRCRALLVIDWGGSYLGLEMAARARDTVAHRPHQATGSLGFKKENAQASG
ncbi:hypothetical protein KI387_026577, partial [Taxus chinensis]